MVEAIFKLVPRKPVDADFLGFFWLVQHIGQKFVPTFEVHDRVVAIENFCSDSKDQVPFAKGQTGWIREIDAMGDMSISFDGKYQKRQWVFKKHAFKIASIGRAVQNEGRRKEGQIYDGTITFGDGTEEDVVAERREFERQTGMEVEILPEMIAPARLHGRIQIDGSITGNLVEDGRPTGTFVVKQAVVQEVIMDDRWVNAAGIARVDVDRLAQESHDRLAHAQCAVIAVCDDFALDESSNSVSSRLLLEKLAAAVSVKSPMSEEIAIKAGQVEVLKKLEALAQLKKLDARSTE